MSEEEQKTAIVEDQEASSEEVVTEELVEGSEVGDVESEAPDDSKSQGEWYILQTYSNHEYKVKRSLDQRILSFKLEDRVFEILIPEEEVVEVRNNEKIERTKKMYPGYIFIRMVFDNDLWYTIKKIPGVSKFMGHQQMPDPVRDEEMLKVLRQVGVKVQRYQIDFEIGDMIKIISGPFRGYTGPAKEISLEKGKLKSLILIFGRETPVEIDFDQVEKLNK
jgi:transcription termination/antitermination protein NusG